MNMKWLKYVNPVLFVLFSIQLFSGMMLRFAPNQFIYEVHENAGPLLLVIVVVHLVLNFGWIKANYFKKI